MTQSPPKMSRRQAKILWSTMTPEQKADFNRLLKKLYGQELILTKVNVDDNEQIQSIVLDDKNKPSQPIAPFAKHFKQEKS